MEVKFKNVNSIQQNYWHCSAGSLYIYVSMGYSLETNIDFTTN